MPDPKQDRPDHNLQMAAERTLLAWIRTGLALMGFGFVVARFSIFLREIESARGEAARPHGGSLAIGVALVAIGTIVLAVAGVRFQRYTNELRQGADIDPPGQGFGVFVALALAILGIFTVLYLVSIF